MSGRRGGVLVRAAVIGAGSAVLAAAAIGAGLWMSGQDPDVPDSGDVHTAAPDCGVLAADRVSEILPHAVLETSESGPLRGGDNAACAWTSAGRAEDAPESVRVDLSARFTDTSGDDPVAGAEAAREQYEAVLPVRAEAVVLPGGAEGHVWRGQAPGSAELAFHVDNLVVRVSYAGASDGAPVSFGRARDQAVRFAEEFGAAL